MSSPTRLSWLSMATSWMKKTFTLNAEEWANLPGTALPSSGGTTGGGSHWHPPVTPAPVPVVVIPPKTGDMTIWQSILHFFGVI